MSEGAGYVRSNVSFTIGEFDQKGGVATKYGTKEALVSMVKTAHEAGIGSSFFFTPPIGLQLQHYILLALVTYVDAVLNHKFGADRKEKAKAKEVDWEDRGKEISEPYDIEVILQRYC
jgi:alpha-amylase